MEKIERTFGPIKLKNRPGQNARLFKNRDGTPMVIDQIVIRKDPSNATKIFLDVTAYDPNEFELVRKEKVLSAEKPKRVLSVGDESAAK